MIQVEELSKTYQVLRRQPGSLRRLRLPVRALDRVSFHIPPGQIVGYIGPNGAGKSTTIKILSGILYPDQPGGSCLVDGRIPWKSRSRHVLGIGVVFGQRSQLWWDLPAGDSFRLLADMYGVRPADRNQRLVRLRRELDLDACIDTPVRQMSLGQRMRCELAAALIHQPRLLFLDEPSIGLDAPSKLALRTFVKELNRSQGTTVILTTHDMDDIEALADRVLLIGKGSLLFDGNMQQLRRTAGAEKRISLDLSAPIDGERLPAMLALTGLRLIDQQHQHLVLAYDPQTLPSTDALRQAIGLGPVSDVVVESQPVEEVISALYRRHQI